MVGIKDVARQAGVSVGTVSNVINRPDMVSEDTRARVLSVIEQLGYVRSESARQLRAGRSRIIALLVLDMANPFFVDVASGAERAARETGLGVMLCNSGESPSEEADYLGLFAEQRVRGVLVTPADTSGRNIASFRRHGIPFVFVDRVVPSAEACSVSVDDVEGGRLAVDHLIERGHERIVYVSGPMHLAQCQDPQQAARAVPRLSVACHGDGRTGPPFPGLQERHPRVGRGRAGKNAQWATCEDPCPAKPVTDDPIKFRRGRAALDGDDAGRNTCPPLDCIVNKVGPQAGTLNNDGDVRQRPEGLPGFPRQVLRVCDDDGRRTLGPGSERTVPPPAGTGHHHNRTPGAFRRCRTDREFGDGGPVVGKDGADTHPQARPAHAYTPSSSFAAAPSARAVA